MNNLIRINNIIHRNEGAKPTPLFYLYCVEGRVYEPGEGLLTNVKAEEVEQHNQALEAQQLSHLDDCRINEKTILYLGLHNSRNSINFTIKTWLGTVISEDARYTNSNVVVFTHRNQMFRGVYRGAAILFTRIS